MADAISEAMEALAGDQPSGVSIDLHQGQHTDEELAELVDGLLRRPDAAVELYFGSNQMTDELGVKLAQLVAASGTVELLDVSDNQLGEATFLAVAAALRVNTSLRDLHLYDNAVKPSPHIDEAFVSALRVNPNRPAKSKDWWLYEPCSRDFARLQRLAAQRGHPSLLSVLLTAGEQ